MRVGYARVSAADQHLAPQLERLSDCGALFYDKKSGRDKDRAQLNACLTYVRAGDTLVCTRLDRLARSVRHLCEMAELLEQKGVQLLVLDQAIDTSSPTGRLLFHVLAAIAEFEVSIRKDQQRAGIDAARAEGRPFGRAHKIDAPTAEALRRMRADGYGIAALARHFKVSKATVYRYLAPASAGTAASGA